jgi:hypothetical protein
VFTPVFSNVFLICLCSVVFVFALSVFVLYIVCQLLPVSLDCPFLNIPSVFSNSYILHHTVLQSVITYILSSNKGIFV